MSRSWINGALALFFTAVWSGCSPPAGPPVALDSESSLSATSTPQPAHAIPLEGRPAAEYRTLDIPSTRLGKTVIRLFPTMKVDPCLERAASAHLQLPDGLIDNEFPLAFTEFALHWAGCPDPSGAVTTLLTSETGFTVFARRLKELSVSSDYTHMGVAVEPATSPYAERWVALLVDRRIQMNAVPAVAQPGASIALQFRLDLAFDGAAIAVTPPRGEVRITEPGLSSEWVVTAVPLGREIGEYWIELIGHDSGGPQVLALFPVQVGRPVPRIWVGAPVTDESWITTDQEAEEVAASHINQDRKRFGHPALIWDEELAELARIHSKDMSENEFFAHVSPTTGTVFDRIQRAGYPASFVAENIAMAPRLFEAQASLMRSPGHRAAILTSDATHFGVGVVTSSSDRNGRIHHLTQVFARRGKTPFPE